MAAVLLRQHERNAEEHFAHRGIIKTERRKGEVFDYLLVEKVDDFARVGHVTGKAVRVPCQNGVVFAALDVLYHLLEMDTDVRFFRAFLLLDDGDVFVGYFEPLGGI